MQYRPVHEGLHPVTHDVLLVGFFVCHGSCKSAIYKFPSQVSGKSRDGTCK
jgi:hypothetical protein